MSVEQTVPFDLIRDLNSAYVLRALDDEAHSVSHGHVPCQGSGRQCKCLRHKGHPMHCCGCNTKACRFKGGFRK